MLKTPIFIFILFFLSTAALLLGAASSSTAEAVLKIEAELSDGSKVILIDGKRFRAFDDKGMEAIIQTDRAARYWQSATTECLTAKAKKLLSD